MLGELRTLCIGKASHRPRGSSLEVVGIESVVKRDGTCGVLSREGLLGSDSLTVNRDGIAGSGIMQLTGDGVVLPATRWLYSTLSEILTVPTPT